MPTKFIVGLVMLCLWAGTGQCKAAEQTEAFLTALQDRGHFDVALRYLDRMSTSTLVTSEFQQEIEYRRGMVLVQAARALKSPALRQQRLNSAEQAFSRFVSAHSQHPYAALAQSQLGNVLVERARSLMLRAEGAGADKQRLIAEAGAIFGEAHEALVQSHSKIKKQLGGGSPASSPEAKEKIAALRAQYVQTYLAIARVLFEQAETIQGDTAKYKAKLTEAAKVFDEVAQKYRNWSAGMYAVLYEGECYQRMGQDQRALSYFKELLQSNDNSPTVRKLKTKTLTLCTASWLTDREAGHDKAIGNLKQWLVTARGSEEDDPAWAELKLSLAKAYLQKSEVESGKPADRARSAARDLAEEVARKQSPARREAQEMLVALGRGDDAPNIDAEAANDFASARDAAKKALDKVKVANATVKILSSQLTTVNDPSRREEINKRLTESKLQSQQMSAAALAMFERASSLATEKDAGDLNSVRYFLAYLYYSQEDYRRAAVLASFVAMRYPDSVAARECANVALAARQRLYQEFSEDSKEVQAGKIAEIAELMISKWPGQPQADTALTTLMNLTIQKGGVDQAEKYLQQIPVDSPRRASAELRVGQAAWREYLKAVTARKGDAGQVSPELQHLRERAQEILAQGIGRIGNQAPNESVIRAALSLAQIYVDSGRSEQALELLENETYGALALVEAGSQWGTRIPGLAVEAYKTSIRANVAAAATSDRAGATIRSAQDLLDRLRDELNEQPDGKQKMISIYVGLAQDLERQLSVATPESRKALSSGFESFLRGAAEGSNDPAVLNWVGETFYSLGKGMQGPPAAASGSESRRYYGEAADSYSRLLALASTEAVPETMAIQAKVRYAMSLRELGKYSQAVKLFTEVLGQRNRVLDIQVEAATTLQRWGDSGSVAAYSQAIQGAAPGRDGKKVIWGWGRLASVIGKPDLLAKNPAYRETFHTARYNIAMCRYKWALASKAGKKQELLARAKHDLVATKKLYGLGSQQSMKRYESLLKTIQKSLGETPVGFSEKT